MYFHLSILLALIIGFFVRQSISFEYRIEQVYYLLRYNVNHNDHSRLIMIIIHFSKMENHFNMSADLFICIVYRWHIGMIDLIE